MHPVLETPRLILRDWRDADLEPFARLNADPRVMAHFPNPLTREESDRFAARIRQRLAEDGWGLFAVEVKGGAPFIGFTGLSRPAFTAAFTPCVEIGWRLAADHWGRGYAPEAARAVLDFGFDRLDLPEIVSFTTVGNANSRRVMEKIGLRHNPADDFDHPNLAAGDPLRRHVLYRLARERAAARPGPAA